MRLARRVVLVTGSSRGIGKGIALKAGAEGARVAVHSRQGGERAAAVVEAIRAEGGEAEAFVADLADPGACRRLVEDVVGSFGQLDALVNNAGVIDPMAPDQADLQAFTHTLDVNLKATWLLSRLCVPHLRQSEGAIVNITSIAGLVAYPFASHYAAAKAAVTATTTSLALEYSPRVRVNAIAPGYTNTGDPMGWSEQRMGDVAARIPLRRFGRPDDIARAVIFLLADAPYMTGATLVIDGGVNLVMPGVALPG